MQKEQITALRKAGVKLDRVCEFNGIFMHPDGTPLTEKEQKAVETALAGVEKSAKRKPGRPRKT